jgi:type VI secretion system protein ImpA
MAGIDFAALTQPIDDAAPCGPDLEAAGDPAYMNFMAQVEGLLPESFLAFDRASIDFPAELATIGELLGRSRDLRLLAIAAKLMILNRDLAGFSAAVVATAALVHERWDDVHPRGEDGDFTLRTIAVQSLDEAATVVLPLQAVPLVQSRRLGAISFRSHLVAAGEAKARDGEAPVDRAGVDAALDETDLAALVDLRGLLAATRQAMAGIAADFVSPPGGEPGSGQAYAVSFERLAPVTARMMALLDGAIVKRDPTAVPAPEPGAAAAAEGEAAAPVASTIPGGSVRSCADARRALAAISAYFAAFEPSSPAVLLVHQAELCIGKSFLEVIRLLVPAVADQAKIPVGGEAVFDLPVVQLSALDGSGSDAAAAAGDAGALPAIAGRADALALLGQVGAFYRVAEPSSPIPLLLERAGGLAERDFMSILQHVLPADALRKITL